MMREIDRRITFDNTEIKIALALLLEANGQARPSASEMNDIRVKMDPQTGEISLEWASRDEAALSLITGRPTT